MLLLKESLLDTPLPFKKKRSSLSLKRKRKLNDSPGKKLSLIVRSVSPRCPSLSLTICKKKPTCKNTERAKLWAVRVLMIGSITYQAVRQKNMLNWTCGVKTAKTCARC